MAAVHYRPAIEAEIDEAVGIFLAAVKDMYERHGISSPVPERAVIETSYRHIFETGIFYVAEVDGRIAAICNAVVRDRLWFLSGFWMLPQFQRQKIGGPLLRRVRDEGAGAGASIFFTWSSVDTTAMASYMKQGMLPGYQILTFGGTLARELPGPRAGYDVQPLDISSAMELDGQVRATAREADHMFWLAQPGYQGRQIIAGGRVAGYYYFNHGLIGPAAWAHREDAPAVIEAACREAAEGASQVRLMIPGINHMAIRFALDSGLRLTAYSHLLTTAPFGLMEQYLPSGPSLF
ncbi:MAG TPA: GNAT family N-acetyltransferase [Pyrinomonadaceae bacterium]|jgi:GNAT superfamily N-acetyltransferase